MATLEQKIAQSEDRTARLKEQARKLVNGQKIVIGGMGMSIARKDPERAKMLLNDINNEVTKKTDLDRLQPLIKELQAVIDKANKPNQSPQDQSPQDHSAY